MLTRVVTLLLLCICLAGCVETRPTLYAFTSASCGPCQTDKPIVAQIAATGFVNVSEVDVDSNPSFASQMGVTQLPCYIAVFQGRELWRCNSASEAYNAMGVGR